MCNDGKEYALPWKSWLATAGLVFLGVTVGGLVAASFVAPGPPRAAHEASAQRAAEPKPPQPSVSPGPPVHPGPGAKAVGSPHPPAKDGQQVKAITPPRRPIKQGPGAGATPGPGQTPVPPGNSAAGPLAQQAPAVQKPEPPAAAQISPNPEKPQPEDALKRAAFARAVLCARMAMADRNPAAAKRQLETAAANAQNQADQTQLERLQILHENLDEFWNGVHAAVAKLSPWKNWRLKDNRVVVVEASRDELTVHCLRAESELPRGSHAHPAPIGDCQAGLRPHGRLEADRRYVPGDGPAGRSPGSPADSWEQAAGAGEQQGRQLMPELDIPIPPPGRGR